jgi:hypothetical protein
MSVLNYIPQAEWDKFRNIINNFNQNDVGKQPFRWLRKIEQMLPFAEDAGTLYVSVTLEALFHYNYVRTWPYTMTSESGQIEGENQVMYIAKEYLKQFGFLNAYGYWDFNWAADRFIVNGQAFKSAGDTLVSQTHDEAILFFVILQKLSPEESTELVKKYG